MSEKGFYSFFRTFSVAYKKPIQPLQKPRHQPLLILLSLSFRVKKVNLDFR
jgi:hypothetical protein